MVLPGQCPRTCTSLSVSDIDRHWTHDDHAVPAVIGSHVTATDCDPAAAVLGEHDEVTQISQCQICKNGHTVTGMILEEGHTLRGNDEYPDEVHLLLGHNCSLQWIELVPCDFTEFSRLRF